MFHPYAAIGLLVLQIYTVIDNWGFGNVTGCRECVHNARNTFVMDETVGCARVNVQFGDDDTSIEVSNELTINKPFFNYDNHGIHKEYLNSQFLS